MDPVTIMKVAKIAIDRLATKEKRKNTLIIILMPLIIVTVLMGSFTYILTNPLEILMNKFGFDNSVEVIQDKYGQVSDTADNNLYDNDMEYDDVTLVSGETKVVYYNQGNPAWGNMLYGQYRPIKATGCGPTSMAIVISTFGTKITPPEACRWSVNNKYIVEGYNNGKPYAMSAHSLIPGMSKAYNLKCTGVTKDTNTRYRIRQALAKGKLVVAIMARGHFTTGGHFIVLRGVTSTGKILVADCSSESRSKKEWDLNLIINEARNGAGAGGPFWIISKK